MLPTARHEILMETDAIRAQFWAAFDAFIPGETVEPGPQAPATSAGEEGERGLVQLPIGSGDDAPARGGAAALP